MPPKKTTAVSKNTSSEEVQKPTRVTRSKTLEKEEEKVEQVEQDTKKKVVRGTKGKKEQADQEESNEEVEKQTAKKMRTNNQEAKAVKVIEETKEVKEKATAKGVEVEVKESVKVTSEKLFPREWYTRDVVTLSRELLGKIIVRRDGDKVIKARIVEAEAYAGIPDKACHAYNGKKTDRNKAMYLEGGHVYVYSIYGNNNCLNITASKEGDPSATLIRAVEITDGLDVAKKNREVKNLSKNGKELTNGPGKMCGAMNIDKSFNGHDVTKPGSLYIIDDDTHKFEVSTTKRINIDYAEEYVHKPWRFCIRNNVFVSVKSPEVPPEAVNELVSQTTVTTTS